MGEMGWLLAFAEFALPVVLGVWLGPARGATCAVAYAVAIGVIAGGGSSDVAGYGPLLVTVLALAMATLALIGALGAGLYRQRQARQRRFASL